MAKQLLPSTTQQIENALKAIALLQNKSVFEITVWFAISDDMITMYMNHDEAIQEFMESRATLLLKQGIVISDLSTFIEIKK